MFISGSPLSGVRAKPTVSNFNVIDQGNWFGFLRGRQAFRFTLSALVGIDWPTILVPALFCQSALNECTETKFIFYDVNSDGDVDFETIEKILTTNKIDAVLLNYLFGKTPKFRDKIFNYCRSNGVILIDDMCHCASAFFAKKEINSQLNYDARIFSFRKFLPLPCGAAAQIHPRFYVCKPIGDLTIPFVDKAKFLIKKELFLMGGLGVWQKFRAISADMSLPNSTRRKTKSEPLKPSTISPYFSELLNDPRYMDCINELRTANYKRLNSVYDSIFNVQSAPESPQNFPISDPLGSKLIILTSSGVDCYRWPGHDLPDQVKAKSDNYPNAIRFSQEVLCVPIHQNVTVAGVAYIAKKLGSNV